MALNLRIQPCLTLFLVVLGLGLCSASVQATNSTAAASTGPKGSKAPRADKMIREALVLTEGAYVYEKPDFDSRVMAELAKGEKFFVSIRKLGAFYKIRLDKGLFGYVADVDVQIPGIPTPGSSRVQPPNQDKEKSIKLKENESTESPQKDRQRSSLKNSGAGFTEGIEGMARRAGITGTRYRGLKWSQVRLREETMGLRPTQALNFFGFQFSGPGVLNDLAETDASFMMLSGAPNYYEQATGRSAGGFAFLMSLLAINSFSDSKDQASFFGFGPFLKYSKWDVILPSASGDQALSLENAVIGAQFSLGVTRRWNNFALRGEVQYYWEKLQYTGFGLSAQMPF